MIKTTMEVLESCEIEFNNESKNRKTLTGEFNDDRLLLEKLAMEGLHERSMEETTKLQEQESLKS